MKRLALEWRSALTGWRFVALCLLLLAGTFLVYRAGLAGGWLYDDLPNIVSNNALRFTRLTWANLWHAAFSMKAGPTWRPLSMLTFALEMHWFGPNPFAFKLTNLLIHLANGLLVLTLVRQMLSVLRETREQPSDAPAERLFALAVTAVWLLAPIELSTVLYAVQREVLLSSFFTLVGLIAYLHFRRALWRHARPAALLGLCASTLVAGVLATISKETGVLLPLYALVLELGLFRFRGREQRASAPVTVYFVLFLVIPAIVGTGWLFTHGVVSGYASRPFTLSERLLTEPRVLLHYLGWILAPRLQALGFFHDDIALSTGLLAPLTTLPAIVLCAALLGAGLWLLPRRPLIAIGILWFFAGQALESTFIPLIVAFEHRNYLASLGPLLVLVAFVAREPSLSRLRPALVGALAVFVVLTGWTTAGRAWQWASNARLAVYQAAHHPNSAQSAYMLARELTDAALGGSPALAPQAWHTLKRAAKLPGSGLIPYSAMIVLAAGTRRRVPARWFEAMLERARNRALQPTDLSALNALDRCLDQGACRPERRRILGLYAGLDATSRGRTPKAERANLLVLYANAIGYATPGQRERAKSLLVEALALAPSNPDLHSNLLSLALSEGDLKAARHQLQALRRLNHHGTLDPVVARYRAAIRAAARRPRASLKPTQQAGGARGGTSAGSGFTSTQT